MLDKAEIWLKKSLQYQFIDVRLFAQALTHRSVPGDNNERLEFLGDAVLDFVISEVVFRVYPLAPEGDLSRLRSSLVKDTSLAELASNLGLGEHLILGGGERKAGGNRRESILADALEAIFGAVFIDSGFDAARAVIECAFGDRLHDFPPLEELRDSKTKLQELLQARRMGLPNYELIKVTGQAHNQKFEVSCSISGIAATTTGDGTTRRGAEQRSAEKMLNELLESDAS